ncbi:hypothetical protein [Roseimicrobium sp. ORNL1]|uniref:hypothetical protein n=1 Tax=Roseimicrobium sp. ORNL1 TaxID=2711231 RepID=UPI0013E1635F|nr:hypothetical protein [Roseimicrobium sp. ORNL1]QIF03467.1 hypothetical protein G5S37_18685 [Roseimicrobium sp. ORNL1]
MPGENVSFVAFGQFHSDQTAFQAVHEQLKKMHTALKAEGRELVLGIEHSDQDVRKPETLAQFHNESLLQKYCDETRARGGVPNVADFKVKHINDMDWSGQTHFLKVDSTTSASDLRFLERQKANVMEGHFTAHIKETVKDVNVGRGAARMEEAALLRWASDNNVPIRGLDPISDKDKSSRLTGGGSRINGSALEEVEYERVQGMGKKGAEIMKGLADKNGGCLVAINMGPAHLGSMEVVLGEELARQSLDKAQVKMCVMVPPSAIGTGQTPEKVSDEFMRHTMKDMRGAHAQLEDRVKECQLDVQTREKSVSQVQGIASRVTGLVGTDTDLLKMMKDNPGKVTKMLNYDVSDKSLGLTEKVIQKAVTRFESGQAPDVRAALTTEVQNHVRKLEEGLEVSREDLDVAQKDVLAHRATVLPFADKVEQRLDNKPGEIYKTFTPGSGGQYDLSGVGTGVRKSVRDNLGISSTSTSTSLQQDMGKDGTKVSTRSQMQLTNTSATTPPKEVVGGFKV